jgi:ribosomal protein L15
VTAKEAYNLLRGASIHKKAILTNQKDNSELAPAKASRGNEGSGEKIESIWIKLDFEKLNEQGNYSYKKFYPDYGFNLESELKRYPIKELNNQQEKEILISSIGRGNAAKATLENGQSVVIEADPQSKKIQFYDMTFKELFVPPIETQELGR